MGLLQSQCQNLFTRFLALQFKTNQFSRIFHFLSTHRTNNDVDELNANFACYKNHYRKLVFLLLIKNKHGKLLIDEHGNQF